MKNKTKPRRVKTITFQPDDDVKADLMEVLKLLPDSKSNQTRLVNHALRIAVKKAGDVLLASQKAEKAALNKAKGEVRGL